MRAAERVTQTLARQHGALFQWAPVCLAAGIGNYFSLSSEPAVTALWWAAATGALCALAAVLPIMPLAARVLLWAAALAGLGFALAGQRAHAVATPVLSYPVYGPVSGRIVAIDRSASGAPRLTLEAVEIARLPPDKTPGRVRLSATGDGPHTRFVPGLHVATTAFLSPPRGAAEPGGFDFRRHAWFQGLGAVGYARVPVVAVAPPQASSWTVWINGVRMALSARLQAAMPGPAGGVAAAIIVGDRSALDPGAVEDLRATNLAHLLAISGLHMGLAAGLVFGAVRGGLALIPRAALYWPIRQIAAICGLIGAALYLAMSGGNVASERAFIMVAVALGAVLLNKRALTLRAVAVAALIVLTLRPEALLSPGFQMSFAATTALVAIFGMMRDRTPLTEARWAQPVWSLFMASFIAGLATAPVAAAHFNQFAHYGLIANMASVPVMSALIMPFCIAGLLLMPLGLEAAPLWVAGQGISWILAVADHVGGWDGAVRGVPAPAPWVLPCLALAALWCVLIRGRARVIGAPVVALGLAGWTLAERPAILIDAEGDLVGAWHEGTRVLSRAKGSSFVAGIWLENDGLRMPQDKAAQAWAAASARWDVQHVAGKRAARAPPDCAPGRIVVSNVPLNLDGPCLVLDPAKLRDTGSIAVWPTEDGLRVVTDRDLSGARLWTPTPRGPVNAADWPKGYVTAARTAK